MPTGVTPPDTLHLVRLARATPDRTVALPGTRTLATLHLARPYRDEAVQRWYVCLSGEVLLDLPHGAFVHLRTGETARLEAGMTRTLTPVREATVLLVTEA